jgi:hypothetical protein
MNMSTQRPKLRRRQIHLDFHTAPEIPDVGRDFDPDEFAETLAAAHVNSVTCFAKCHHGMFTYPSKVGPIHPSLKFDLLGAMIDACHKRDINVPAYISVQWDQHAARTHPEWRVVDPDGTLPGPVLDKVPYATWPALCILSGYRQYLADTVRELLDRYDVDGVFFDICMDQVSCSEPALAKMRQDGLNPEAASDRASFARREAIAFLREFYQLVQKLRRRMPVFFNGRIDISMRDSLPYLTHLEVESLPSGQWGYDHFQRIGRYARTLRKPFLGMTARFHKSWADFGTLKNPAALEFESLTAIAHGGGVSIGDQLHPRGRLDAPAYECIGRVFGRIRDLEPWCDNAVPVTQIGLVSLLTHQNLGEEEALAADRGATAMLNQTHLLFDVLDADARLDDYELIILPDGIAPEPAFVKKVRTYMAAGGRVLFTGRSLLDQKAGKFALPNLGVDYIGSLESTPFYIRGKKELDLPVMDHCMYEAGQRVRARKNAKVLANVVATYFNRSTEHYCSHAQSPPSKLTRDPAVVMTTKSAYINCPIFSAYHKHGNLVYRDIFSACIERLLPNRLLRTSLPSSAQVSVMDQKRGRKRNRVVHILHYPPTRRTGEIDIVESPLPLIDVGVELACTGKVESIVAIPTEHPLPFQQNGPIVRFVIPRIIGHQAICVAMKG